MLLISATFAGTTELPVSRKQSSWLGHFSTEMNKRADFSDKNSTNAIVHAKLNLMFSKSDIFLFALMDIVGI